MEWMHNRFHKVAGSVGLACMQQTYSGMHATIFSNTQISSSFEMATEVRGLRALCSIYLVFENNLDTDVVSEWQKNIHL